MKTIPNQLAQEPGDGVRMVARALRPFGVVSLALTPLLLLAACGRPAPAPRSGAPAAGRAPLRVVTSVLPVELFSRAVAGECARVEPLLPAGADLHDLQVSPRQLARLREADVLVLNGLGLEASLERLLSAAGNPRLRRIDSAAAVAALPPSDAHAHGHEHEQGQEHGGGPGAVNPHVWLDPRRAAAQVRAIRDGLAAADPSRAGCFGANAAAYLGELEQLDAHLASRLAPYAGRRIVSHHDLAPYFADRYRLRAESLVGLPAQNPSAADLRRLIGVLKRNEVRALLVEPRGGAASFRAVADDLGLPLLPFDPIETATPAESLRPRHYLEAMRRNGASVLASLMPPGAAGPASLPPPDAVRSRGPG